MDAATGKAVWTHATDNYINGSQVPSTTGEIVFGGCDSFIHVLQLSDGKELRQIDSDAYIASSVAIMDDRGYVITYMRTDSTRISTGSGSGARVHRRPVR